jgi:RNA-directed DNA polymerase
VKQGYGWAVDVDLEKFFDTVDHDTLMHYLGLKVRDRVVLRLIGRYLRAGFIDKDGNRHPSPVGTPQGGPISPILSNILLH